jgi:hypothetical protein
LLFVECEREEVKRENENEEKSPWLEKSALIFDLETAFVSAFLLKKP